MRACHMLLVAVLAACLFMLGGCVSAGPRAPDWVQVRALLSKGDQALAGYQELLDDDDRRERLARVRAVNQRVLAQVEARIASDAASDPSPVLNELMTVAGMVIAEWPDPRQRAIASATYASLRVGLTLAGVDLRSSSPRIRDGPMP